jgi:hypothetical protein
MYILLPMFRWLQLPHTNPGLNTTPLRFTKNSNAYMLVYIRESDKEKIICDLNEKDISEHLKVLLVYIHLSFHRYCRICSKIIQIFPDQTKKGTAREGA